MGGKATISTEETRINAFQVQRSSYGVPLPVLLGGTNRIAANLLWYGGFKAIANTTRTSSGGKGGGVKQTNTTYAYKASLVMGICEGPIAAIVAVMRDKSTFTNGAQTAMQQAGLSLGTGEQGQAVWPYLTTNHAAQAIGYSRTAIAYAADYELTSGAGLQNHTFEVQSLTKESDRPDANPRDCVVNFLTDPFTGVPGWTADLLGDLDDFATYCRAATIFVSPLLDQQRQASETLKELLEAANAAPVWSEGVLKIKPYGTQAVTGNGETWTPDLTPVYDLTNRDFLVEDDDDDPVRSDLKRRSDAFNFVQVEFLNRARQYAVETMPAFDQAAIEAHAERKENPVSLHCICDPQVAAVVAQLRLQRICYVRETFEFRLPWTFSLLEPGDYLTLTETRMGLDRQLVRILSIDEDEDGDFTLEAEEVLVGVADAALYAPQAPTGYIGDYDADPGDVTDPVMFTPPSTLTEGRLELWAAVTGLDANWGGCEMWVSLDGDSYQRVGAITAGARYGVATTALPSAASPDTTNTLGVDLAASAGELLPATQAEADAAVTLFYLGGELLAYRDADLTGTAAYDLSYLLRGLNGSQISAHSIGADFVRIDQAVFRHAFQPEQIGETVYVKFRSFNVFGRALQDLEDLDPYTSTLAQPGALPDRVTGITRTNPTTESTISLAWTASARAERYKVFCYSSDGATFYRSANVTAPAFTYLDSERTADGATGSVLIIIVANNAAGDAPGTSYTNASTGGGAGGPQPAAVTGAIAYTPDFNQFGMVCDASTDPATTGYVLYVSATSGFTPTGTPNGTSVGPNIGVYSSAGVRYGRMAAVNADWDGDVADLNFSAEDSALVSDYREDCPAPETLILMADGTEKPAGQLVVGDQVRTKHETTREWMTGAVMDVQASAGPRWRVAFSNGRDLVSTPNHRLGLPGGGFEHVDKLGPGDQVDGVEPLTVIESGPAPAGPVVRLTIGDARTCLTAGALSHNIKMITEDF